MSVRGLRRGEWLVVAALVALVASLFVHWFPELDPGSVYVLRGYGASATSGPVQPDGGPTWTALGLPWSALVVVAGLAMLLTVVLAARAGGGRPTYGALASVVVALPLSFLVLVAVAFRLLIVTPALHLDDGETRFSVDATLAAGSWIGLAALLLGVVGLWVAMADDRTSASDTMERPVPLDVPTSRSAAT